MSSFCSHIASIASNRIRIHHVRHASQWDWPVKSLCHAYSRLHGKGFGITFTVIFFCGASLFPQLLPLRLWPTVLVLMLLLFLDFCIHLVHREDNQLCSTQLLNGTLLEKMVERVNCNNLISLRKCCTLTMNNKSALGLCSRHKK